jgi:hypothetical protein
MIGVRMGQHECVDVEATLAVSGQSRTQLLCDVRRIVIGTVSGRPDVDVYNKFATGLELDEHHVAVADAEMSCLDGHG